MKLKALIVILVSIAILTHCNNNKNYQRQITQEEVVIDETKSANVRFSLKANVESDFIAYPRIAVSPLQDKVILYGISSSKNEKPGLTVKTYDKSLRFLSKKIFLIGQGPGDVGNNNIISIGENTLMISENSNQRVSIYNNDWIYKTSLKHILPIDAFEIYENGKLFISKSIIYQDDKEIVSFMIGSIDGFKTNSFFKTDPFLRDVRIGGIKKRLLGGITTHSWFYKNNEIVLIDCGSYRLLKFDGKGKKLKDITVKIKKKKTDRSLADDYFRDQGLYSMRHRFRFYDTVDPAAAMIPLFKGFVVIRRIDYSNKCNNYADGDYFSAGLEYIGKVKVPCFHNLFTLFTDLRKNECAKFDNGFLYLVQEKEYSTIIEKWEVTE